jgi:hypothetical protein
VCLFCSKYKSRRGGFNIELQNSPHWGRPREVSLPKVITRKTTRSSKNCGVSEDRIRAEIAKYSTLLQPFKQKRSYHKRPADEHQFTKGRSTFA